MVKKRNSGMEYKWANELYINELIDKKSKQREIINNLYEVYNQFLSYEFLAIVHEEIIEEKKVIMVQKAKQNLTAITASASGLVLGAMMGMQANVESFIAALSTTAAGIVALRKINKDDIGKVSIDKKELRELKSSLKLEAKILERIAENYIDSIKNYLPYYDESKGDFLIEIYDIFEENRDYVKQKHEDGTFDKKFDIPNIINFHDDLFIDRNEFNFVINSFVEENRNSRQKKRTK